MNADVGRAIEDGTRGGPALLDGAAGGLWRRWSPLASVDGERTRLGVGIDGA